MHPRFSEGISFVSGLRLGGFGTAAATVWILYLYHFDKVLFWWISVVLLPLMLSVPIALWVSSVRAGRPWLKKGLLRVPSETIPPPEISRYKNYLSEHFLLRRDKISGNGFRVAVVEPTVHFLHLRSLPGRRKLMPRIAKRRRRVIAKVLSAGPQGLTKAEKKEILIDPLYLSRLHERIWALPENQFSKWRQVI